MGRADQATLVRICDPAGRPHGTGFVADDLGTVVTGHHVIAGLTRPLLRPQDGSGSVLEADSVTAYPEHGLALLRATGLSVPALPIGARDRVTPGTYVRLVAGGWREARVLATTSGMLELAIGTDGSDALRLAGAAAGGPVLDAATGAVLAVLGAVPPTGAPAGACARTLHAALPEPLAALLRRNAELAPAYGQDLNLAAVLELTGGSLARTGTSGSGPEHIERPDIAGEFADFTERHAAPLVLGLVGAPGTGRTTELRMLAARRAQGPEPAPTLWLRGADLRAGDTSLADAVARTLHRAARILAAPEQDIGPARVARLAHDAGRPLLVVLDGPEEMPPAQAHNLREWTTATTEWLASCGTRLAVACRPEYWDQAGALFPPGLLHRPGGPALPPEAGPRTSAPVAALAGVGGAGDDRAPGPTYPADVRAGRGSGAAGGAEASWAASEARVPAHCVARRGPGTDTQSPPAVRMGELDAHQARRVREAYGLPPGAVATVDERHPLTLRLLAEVHRALPGALPSRPGREEVLGAYLDLVCLRIAVRIASDAAPEPRGSALRGLVAAVAGRMHEAGRRCLGPGHGQLDGTAFEELFPWRAGWASAVLMERLLVPAGSGYRFAHEELADWIQGGHLDLDAALRSLLHLRQEGPEAAPVPRHRVGTVVQALLHLGRRHEASALEHRLTGLVDALHEPDPDERPVDARWWAARLLHEVLPRVPDAERHLGVLHRLAERPDREREFGPRFWERLSLDDPARLDLLRRLVPADPPAHGATATPRYLELADQRLAADPRAVQPLLCRWFGDDTPLAADPDSGVRPTVGAAAQALLYARRGLAPDDLTEALVDTAHPRATELLDALAEDEPSVVCRAVDRWARDPRPARRAAAAAHALAPRPTTDRDREHLRGAARALLADPAHHGTAFALLVRDPVSRPRHLDRALDLFVAGDPHLPAGAVADALTTHAAPVLAAFRARLLRPDGGADAGELLATLAEAVTDPATARRAAALVCEYVDHRPDGAAHAAAYVHRRLDGGPDARDVLFPLVTHLLRGRPAHVRSALAPVLAAPGGASSRVLRAELLDVMLRYERYEAREVAVLDALLCAAAHGSHQRPEEHTRALVHRAGLLLARTPKGAACLDRRLVELARDVPGFATLAGRWLADDPQEWAAVVGPGARRALRTPGSPVPMPTGSAGHGSLRPALSAITYTGSGEERSQCSAGVAWRTSPRTGDAASSPSAPTTAYTADTS
ncbi:trypsin-like peptidase domain-containing protein [Streptomyces sp. NPDC096176]|uniref:trypsin-like peptidase domain-containing protein n=1 Tax=Streptomyces sp. NPDC096176 TaxID=3366079 RepID=UPI00380F04D6